MLLPVDKYILSNATHVLAISTNMKMYLEKSRNIDKKMITVVENWQDEREFIAYMDGNEAKRSDSMLSFMYLGNIGPVAGIEFFDSCFC